MKHILSKFKQKRRLIILFTLIVAAYFYTGCPIRFFTGISCPGCGMTRAVLALCRLDFALAFEMHPLVILLPVAAAIYFTRRLIPKRMMTALCFSALVQLVAVYIIRMTHPGAVVYADIRSGLIYKLFNNIL